MENRSIGEVAKEYKITHRLKRIFVGIVIAKEQSLI